jgi:hypothetical protein
MFKSLSRRRFPSVATAVFASASMLAASLSFAGSLALTSSPAFAQSANQAKFCQHSNYGGQCFTVNAGGGNMDLSQKPFPGGGNWNDSISSVKVGDNVRVRATANKNLTGDCVVLLGRNTGSGGTGDYKYLSSYNAPSGGTWNDKISAYQVVAGTTAHC